MTTQNLYNAIIEDLQAIESAFNDSETVPACNFDDNETETNGFFHNSDYSDNEQLPDLEMVLCMREYSEDR